LSEECHKTLFTFLSGVVGALFFFKFPEVLDLLSRKYRGVFPSKAVTRQKETYIQQLVFDLFFMHAIKT
jgi:hypothetical protein